MTRKGWNELPNPDVLRDLLHYEPDTGKLFWKKRSQSMFEDSEKSAVHKCRIWNSRYAFKEAFTALSSFGYLRGSIFNRHYVAHRVIWAIHTEKWPDHEIDHINGNRSDNRIKNLRAVTRSENQKNVKRPENNTSGIIGVSWHSRTRTWRARIGLGGKSKTIGYFLSIEDARLARKAAEKKHGFHENHGRAS